MTQYRKRYLVESSRLKGWDYSANGWYYITIITKNRECFLGQISNGIMQLSDIGLIVLKEWRKSFALRLELICDCYIIMPNHIHAIIRIDNPNQYGVDLGNECIVSDGPTQGHPMHNRETHNRETHNRASLQGQGTNHCELIDYPGLNQKKSNRSPKSISSFVAGFKSAATTRINQFRGTPFRKVWQPRFWDRLIRDKEELARIRKYIQDNPGKWEGDNI
jgi:putative transposase